MLAIPQWPTPNSAEGARFFAAALAIVKAWKAHGVSNPFAFGMLAQAEAETSLDPNARGDWLDVNGKPLPWSAHPVGTPTSFGLHQWKRDRLDDIRKGTGIDIYADVMAGKGDCVRQVAAASWELSGPMSHAFAPIASQKTAFGAAMQACALFERAGALEAAERRGQLAERWTAHWASLNA